MRIPHTLEQMMKILIVDDHPLIVTALRHLLVDLDPHIEAVEAASCGQALNVLEAEQGAISLILLDLSLPGMYGLHALPTLRERYPNIPVVILSANEDPAVVVKALDEGAMGFIPKTSSNALLLGALKLVISGGVYVPQQVLMRDTASRPGPALPDGASRRSATDLGLTPRQADVLALLLQGKPTKLICRELDLAEGTVKVHIAAILRVLGVSNRTQAVLTASRLGLQLPQMAFSGPGAN
jgi:DNA-binding NarL/FixJ family response regulator